MELGDCIQLTAVQETSLYYLPVSESDHPVSQYTDCVALTMAINTSHAGIIGNMATTPCDSVSNPTDSGVE